MILIVSSSDKDRALFTALCDQRGWPCQTCSSLADFLHSCDKTAPAAVLARHRLSDGYSDDLYLILRTHFVQPVRTVVLMGADASAKAEARQITLGADCVLRDPIRIEVLLEYLSKFRGRGEAAPNPARSPSFTFAGAEVFSLEHRAALGGTSVHLSPQETNFLRVMARTPGKVVTYPMLYAELFGRRFSGETSNCRVLLGKTTATLKQLGIDVRAHVTVIPKSGYRYDPEPRATPAPTPASAPASPARSAPQRQTRRPIRG